MTELAEIISDCADNLKDQCQDQIIPSLRRLKSKALSLAESRARVT